MKKRVKCVVLVVEQEEEVGCTLHVRDGSVLLATAVRLLSLLSTEISGKRTSRPLSSSSPPRRSMKPMLTKHVYLYIYVCEKKL